MEIGKVLGKPRGRGYQLAVYIGADKAQAFADALYALLRYNPLKSKSDWIVDAILELAGPTTPPVSPQQSPD